MVPRKYSHHVKQIRAYTASSVTVQSNDIWRYHLQIIELFPIHWSVKCKPISIHENGYKTVPRIFRLSTT